MSKDIIPQEILDKLTVASYAFIYLNWLLGFKQKQKPVGVTNKDGVIYTSYDGKCYFEVPV